MKLAYRDSASEPWKSEIEPVHFPVGVTPPDLPVDLLGKTIASIHAAVTHEREDPGWLIAFTDGTRVYLRATYFDSGVQFISVLPE